jgi:hypothetical protein
MQGFDARDALPEHAFVNDSNLRSHVCWIAHWSGHSCIPQRVFALRSTPQSKSEWNEIWRSVQLAADLSGELGSCFVAIGCREYWLLTVMKNGQPCIMAALDRSYELALGQSENAP